MHPKSRNAPGAQGLQRMLSMPQAWRPRESTLWGEEPRLVSRHVELGPTVDAHCPCLRAWGRVIQGRDKQGRGGKCTVRELPRVPRPGARGILDRRATAKWSPGMDQVHKVAEGMPALGTWLERTI